jgi:hypothetical protein
MPHPLSNETALCSGYFDFFVVLRVPIYFFRLPYLEERSAFLHNIFFLYYIVIDKFAGFEDLKGEQ